VATRRGTTRLSEALDLFDAAPPETEESAFGVEGHRLRLRERFLTAGPDALADHEMLELMAICHNAESYQLLMA
jgi:DNA repair protein RadC